MSEARTFSFVPGICLAFFLTFLTSHILAAGLNSPELKWKYGGCSESFCQTGWYGSPAVGNLDDDAQLEVVWGSYDVVALNGSTGAVEWRATGNGRVWASVALVDIQGNGKLETVAGRGGDEVTVYDNIGDVLWSKSPFVDGEVRTLAVTDLEKDGLLEVISGKAGSGSTRQVNIFDSAGTVRSGWPARHDGDPGSGWGMYNQNIAIADMNGNDSKELFAPTDTHYVTALDSSGEQIPTNNIYGENKVWSEVGVNVDHEADLRGYTLCDSELRANFANSAPAIADLDNNGSLELVVTGNVYDCSGIYIDKYQMPWIFNLDRTRWSNAQHNWTILPGPDANSGPLTTDYNVIESVMPNIVLADLDGDGELEILHPSYDGRLHAYWLDKTEHGNWPFTVTGVAKDIRFAGEPVVTDLDADGHAEILFTSWPTKGSNLSGKLHMLDYLGNILFEVDLPAPLGGDWNGGMGAPTLANIDDDADLELVIGTSHSGVVAYDLPGSENAKILWGTGRYNYERTGFVLRERGDNVFMDGFEN